MKLIPNDEFRIPTIVMRHDNSTCSAKTKGVPVVANLLLNNTTFQAFEFIAFARQTRMQFI